MGHAAQVRRDFVAPPPYLRPFIDRVWMWESAAGVPLPILMPGTGSELILHYRKPFQIVEQDGTRDQLPKAHLACLRSRSCNFESSSGVGFVAVRFRASAIRQFGKLSVVDIRDRFLPASAAFGPEVDELCLSMENCNEFRERANKVITFLEQQFLRYARGVEKVDHAIDALYYGDPELSVSEIADSLGQSTRQLERTVRDTAGFTPKHYRRLARFHHTVRSVLLSGNPNYLDTALSQGYYDQAHFIHEFGAFTGRTPGAVFTSESVMSHFYNTRLSR